MGVTDRRIIFMDQGVIRKKRSLSHYPSQK